MRSVLRRRWARLLGVLILCVPVFVYWYWFRAPSFRAEGVRSATITFRWEQTPKGPRPSSAEYRYQTRDESTLGHLVEVLKAGRPVGYHKCAAMGVLRLEYADHTFSEFGVTPGHSTNRY